MSFLCQLGTQINNVCLSESKKLNFEPVSKVVHKIN